MTEVARMRLEGGGSVLVEAPAGLGAGPVKAGRGGIRELPMSLRDALVPITESAKTILDQLRSAGPREIDVEFGVDLATEAGAVITKATAGCHLRVTMRWRKEDAPDES